MPNFTHDHPGDLADDHELSVEFEGNLVISISKVGGGTIGRSYDGHWHYTVEHTTSQHRVSGSDFFHPTPITHDQAAHYMQDFIDARSSEFSLIGMFEAVA